MGSPPVKQSALFDVPEGARVPRRARAPRHRAAATVVTVPIPEPILPGSRSEPAQPIGPCLAGMEDVGTDLLDHVDAMQRVAVTAPPGPLLINAGPGTGKTYVLIRRIAYLVSELHVPAAQCLVLVADAEAARHMEQQLSAYIGSAASEMTIAAFSTYAAAKMPPLGHIFVDDLQQMPPASYEALSSERGALPSFTATGDPDSRIDDDPFPFSRFAQDFPDARIVRLSRNHRSTAPIIAAAMQLITPMTRVPGRGMLPARSAAGTAPVGRFFAANADEEAQFPERLSQHLASFDINPADIAVLRAEDIAATAGLQFPVVCCLDVTAETFPDTAQARRNLFRAMTRAQNLLYLSHTGHGSPLLDDIDTGLFTAFGEVRQSTPRTEQPRLL